MFPFFNTCFKPVIGLLLLVSLFSCKKELDPNPEMPEIVDILWTDYEGAVKPGTIRFFGAKLEYPNLGGVNSPAINYSWDFGDKSPISVSQSPDHTYDFNGTYNVTVSAREFRNGAPKLPGNPMGYVTSFTKPIEVTKVPAYIEIEEQSGYSHYSEAITVSRSGNNLVVKAEFGTAPNTFSTEINIPENAQTGSTYYTGANYPESNQTSSIFFNGFQANATSCPKSNASITIKNRTETYLGGTFNGTLTPSNCNQGVSYIKYGNFSVYF